MRKLRRNLHSAMATRRHRPLPVQRMRSLPQDERNESAPGEAAAAIGKNGRSERSYRARARFIEVFAAPSERPSLLAVDRRDASRLAGARLTRDGPKVQEPVWKFARCQKSACVTRNFVAGVLARWGDKGIAGNRGLCSFRFAASATRG